MSAKDISRFGDIVGRKNLLINGGFNIWQRGTNFVSGGGAITNVQTNRIRYYL